MEKLKSKQTKFLKSLNAFERTIEILARSDNPDYLKQSLVAASIKHFEISLESAWKFLQAYLVHFHNQQIDSPKKVFRECFALNILDNRTTKALLDMYEARNATVHDYDEETAQETCRRLLDYYNALKQLKALAKVT